MLTNLSWLLILILLILLILINSNVFSIGIYDGLTIMEIVTSAKPTRSSNFYKDSRIKQTQLWENKLEK